MSKMEVFKTLQWGENQPVGKDLRRKMAVGGDCEWTEGAMRGLGMKSCRGNHY